MFDWVLSMGIVPKKMPVHLASCYSYCKIFLIFNKTAKYPVNKDLSYLQAGVINNNIDTVKYFIEEQNYEIYPMLFTIALQYTVVVIQVLIFLFC
jgi:hypothetical protein